MPKASRRTASERDDGGEGDRNVRQHQRLYTPPVVSNEESNIAAIIAAINATTAEIERIKESLGDIHGHQDNIQKEANNDIVYLKRKISEVRKRLEPTLKLQRELYSMRYTFKKPEDYENESRPIQRLISHYNDQIDHANRNIVGIERQRDEELQQLEAGKVQLSNALRRAKRRKKELTTDAATRQVELERQRQYSECYRANQTEDESRVRLSKKKAQSEHYRANQTEDETRQRLDRQIEISQRNREERTPARRLQLLKADRLYQRARRLEDRLHREIQSGGASEFEHDVDAALEMVAGRSGNVQVARIIQHISAAVAQRQFVDHLTELRRILVINSAPDVYLTEEEHKDLSHETIEQERRQQRVLEIKAKEKLESFIRDSMPNEDRSKELIRECMHALGNGRSLYFCGSCGVRQLPSEPEYEALPLIDCGRFEYDNEQLEHFHRQNLYWQLVKSSYCEADAQQDQSFIAATVIHDEVLSLHTRMQDDDEEMRLAQEAHARTRRYHLHPEAMTRNTATDMIHTRLCPTCFQYATSRTPIDVQPLSIRNGHDYGYWKRALRHPEIRHNAELKDMEPSSVEELCATVVRLYQHVYLLLPTPNGIVTQKLRMGDGHINVSQLAMKAHVVTFAHDAAAQASELIASSKPEDRDQSGQPLMRPLLADGVRERIRLKFFAPTGMENELRRSGMHIPDLRSRANVVEKLLTIFSQCNSDYEQCILQANNNNNNGNLLSEAARAAINDLQQALVDQAANEANPGSVNAERDEGVAMLMHREHNEHVSEAAAPGALEQAALEHLHNMGELRGMVGNISQRVMSNNSNHNQTGDITLEQAENMVNERVAAMLNARTEVEDVMLTSRHNVRIDDRIRNMHNEVNALHEAMQPPEPEGGARPSTAELRTHHNASGPGGSATTAMNEFKENRRLLWGSHPLVFPLGYVNSREGPLPSAVSKHLMCQFTNVAASHTRLLFLLHNQKERHNVSKAANAKVRNDPDSLEWFRQKVYDQTFQDRLQQAVDSMARSGRTQAEIAQTEREMRDILKEVNPHVYSAGRFSNTSAFDKRSGMAQFYAMSQMYGMPAIFLTFSVDDTTNKTSIEFSVDCVDNESFPVKQEGLQEMLQRGAHFESSDDPGGGGGGGGDGRRGRGPEGLIDPSLAGLCKLVSSHPVASTIYFMELRSAILKLILGTSDFNAKKATSYAERKPGILGKVDTYFGAIEAQGRGALHGHFVFWIPALSPLLFDSVSTIEALKEAMYRVVQGICVTEATNEKHIIAVLAKRKMLPPDVVSHARIIESVNEDYQQHGELTLGFLLRPSFQPAIDLNDDAHLLSDVKKYGENVALSANMHIHTGTCKKPLLGQTRCRLCLPRNFCPRSRFVQLSGQPTTGEVDPNNITFNSFEEFQHYRNDKARQNHLMYSNQSPTKKLPRYIPSATTTIDPKIGFVEEVTPAMPMPFVETSSRTSTAAGNSAATNSNINAPKTVIFEQQRKEINKADLERAARNLQNHRTKLARHDNEAMAVDDFLPAPPLSPLPPDDGSIQYAAGQVMLQILERCNNGTANADDREVFTELFYRNGYLVEHNPIIAACCNANTNLQLLGTDVQAKNVLMYLIKYLCKDGAPIQNTVSIVCQAFKHSQRYAHREIPVDMTRSATAGNAAHIPPNPAAPASGGGDEPAAPPFPPPPNPPQPDQPNPVANDHTPRECVHFIANILNQMNGIAEVGGCMAAYILFDNKVIQTPERFQYVFPVDAIRYSERNYESTLTREERRSREQITDAIEFFFDDDISQQHPGRAASTSRGGVVGRSDQNEDDEFEYLHDAVLREIFSEDDQTNNVSSIGDDDVDGDEIDITNQHSARVAAAADLAVVEDDNNNVNVLDRVGLTGGAHGLDERVFEGDTNMSTNHGRLPIYIINDPNRPNERIKIAVSLESLFAARGEYFKDYCYDTWTQVVEIVPRKNPTANPTTGGDDDGPQRAGRRSNKRVLLDAWHPLYTSHEQQLRSKYPTNIYSGPRPPPYPGHRPPLDDRSGRLPDKWKRQMRAVVKFVLVMFKPWQLGNSSRDATAGPLTYREFVLFMSDLSRRSHESNYHMHLLLKIQHILGGLNCNKRLQQMQNDYRNMSCDFWKEPPPWWVMKQEIMNRERRAGNSNRGNNPGEYGDDDERIDIGDPFERIASDELLQTARDQLARLDLANNPQVLGVSEVQRDARIAAHERFMQDCEDLILLPGSVPSRLQQQHQQRSVQPQSAQVLQTIRRNIRQSTAIDRTLMIDNNRNAANNAQQIVDRIRNLPTTVEPAPNPGVPLAGNVGGPAVNNPPLNQRQQALIDTLQNISSLPDGQRQARLKEKIRVATQHLLYYGVADLMEADYDILEHPLMRDDPNLVALYGQLNDGQQRLVRSFLLYVFINWMVYGAGIQSASKSEREQQPFPPADQLPEYPPLLQLLLLAGPGFGKTFLMQTLHKMLLLLYTRGITCAAYTGVAASLLPNGKTVHGFLCFGRGGKHDIGDAIKTGTLDAIITNMTDCPFVVIDEVSMVGEKYLIHLHEHIEGAIRLHNNPTSTQHLQPRSLLQLPTVFFGGTSIILCGDFHQIVPVGELALYKTVTKVARANILGVDANKVTPRNRTAYAILSSFTLVTLTQQVRAAEDPVHTECLNTMRSWDPVHDNLPRISDGVIQQLQEHMLTADEYNNDEQWREAPFLVSGNTERVILNSLCTERFATLNELPIITWPLECSVKLKPAFVAPPVQEGGRREPSTINVRGDSLTPEERDELIQNNLSKVEFPFVRHAPALLTTNICTQLSLCNGSKVYLHSLVIKAEDVGGNQELQNIKNQIRNARAGDRVSLDVPPAFVNVIVLKQAESVETEAEFMYSWESRIENVRFTREISNTLGVIVPIPRLTSTTDFDEYRIAVGDNLRFLENKIRVKPSHDVVPAFAFTFHKSQGQTISRAIVFLHPDARPAINFHSLFTVLSRVRGLEYLRIAPFFHIQRRTVYPSSDDGAPGGVESEHFSQDSEHQQPYDELKWMAPNLSFLQELQPDPDLLLFMRSYDENGRWSEQLFHHHAQNLMRNAPSSRTTTSRRGDVAATNSTVLAITTTASHDQYLVSSRRSQQSGSRQSVVPAPTGHHRQFFGAAGGTGGNRVAGGDRPQQVADDSSRVVGTATGGRSGSGTGTGGDDDRFSRMLAITEAAMSQMNIGDRRSTNPAQLSVPSRRGSSAQQTNPLLATTPFRTSATGTGRGESVEKAAHRQFNVTVGDQRNSVVFMYILARVYGVDDTYYTPDVRYGIHPSELLTANEWNIIVNAYYDDLRERRNLPNPFPRLSRGKYQYDYLDQRKQEEYLNDFDDTLFVGLQIEVNPSALREKACRALFQRTQEERARRR